MTTIVDRVVWFIGSALFAGVIVMRTCEALHGEGLAVPPMGYGASLSVVVSVCALTSTARAGLRLAES